MFQKQQRLPTSRGTILASNGTVLAIDQPAWGVYASLSNNEKERELFFSKKDSFVETVANVLSIDKKILDGKLKDDFRYVPIARGVSREKKEALEYAEIFSAEDMRSARLPHYLNKGFGLYFEKEEKRVYPNNSLASHIIGFMGKDSDGNDIGRYGIEGYYFKDMITMGSYSYEQKDSQGNVILTTEYNPVLPRFGQNITLTIDPGIQSKIERVLAEETRRMRAKSATCIIMEPSTGRIIAMANYPDYNPNEYGRVGDMAIYRNKAVSDAFEPGSIQKPITVAIALETGAVEEDYTYNDESGFIEVEEETFYTWDRKPDGLLTLSKLIESSNNPAAADVAMKIDKETYYQKLKEFGFGQFIGIGLEDEASSFMLPYNRWTIVDRAANGFGQGIAATPLQMIASVNTIANDGKRMRPYIVKEISDDEERIVYEPYVEAQPISKDTADKVTKMMVNTVRYGGPSSLFNKELSGYKIAGKTGTAQIASKKITGYQEGKMNTTFVGFAPADNPKMIMLVKIEEPQTTTLSTYTSVPAWINLFKAVADDLGIEKK